MIKNTLINPSIVFLILLMSFTVSITGCNSTNEDKTQQKPNILFIAIDDMNDWTGFLGVSI